MQVKGVLRGPGRWEVSGHASFSILFWDVDIGFELAWGDAAAALLAAVAVGAELVAALADRGNWAAELPVGGDALITLAASDRVRRPVAAHPLGELSVTQKVVPLGVDITRVGTARPIRRHALRHRDGDGRRPRHGSAPLPRRALRPRALPGPGPGGEAVHAVVRALPGRDRDLLRRLLGGERPGAFDPEFETVYLGEQPPAPQPDTVPPLILVAQAQLGSASWSALRRDQRLAPAAVLNRVEVTEPVFVTVDAALGVVGAPASFTEAAQRAARRARWWPSRRSWR